MKIGVIAELFRLPLPECLDMAAKLGCQGVQLYAASKASDLTAMGAAELAGLKRRCDDLGLAISAVCGDLPGHGFQIASENPDKIDRTKRIIDITIGLGSRVVTTHIGVIPSDASSKTYEAMLSALSELGRHASKSGACLAIETGPEPTDVLAGFVAKAGKGVGVNLDPANLLMVLDADSVAAVATLGPHIVHTHAKDGVHYRKCDPAKVYGAFAEGGFEKLVAETGRLFEEVPLGRGGVKWDAYLRALAAVGFDGFLTIEREVGASPREDIAMAVGFLNEKLTNLK